MDILQKNEYHTDDPHVKELINEEIRKEIAVNLGQGDLDPTGKNKKGKSAHEQTLLNLRNTDGKFKYLWGEGDDVEEYDYQQEENRRKRESEMELIEPPRYKVIGWISERGSKLKKRPILRMSDLYLSHNPKIRRLINRVFDRHIYGRAQTKKEDGDVIVSRTACNATQLQQILKNYQGHQEDYGFDNQQMRLNQKQLEDFIIERGQSKQNYFLFYKNEEPKNVTFNVKNNPLHSNTFIQQLHNDVRRLQQRYSRLQQIEQSEDENERAKQQKKEGQQKKAKQYFGQFKQITRQKPTQKFTIQDNFESKIKSTDQIVNSIIDYYSFLDNQVLDQKYLQSLPQNDKLELNLANPHFFQPKLHTILHKQKEFFQEQEYKAKLAEANKGNMLDMSLISGRSHKKSKMMSGFEGQGNQNGQREDQQLSIQKVIETEMKNVYKQPLKHSDIAIKYDCIKFTFEEQCFANLHRYNFPFHEHLLHGKIRLEIVSHKNRKAKPNGLVINSQMKESNDKFSRKEDISLTRGQFVLIQYIEENPLLLSDVGMCERMIIQVNYLDVLEKVKQQQLQIKSFEEMEEERQRRLSLKNLSFEKNCQVWRKCIRSIFGDYGKQFFWQPKNNGKLIGVPDGPGVILMQSNLATVPIVKKKPTTRDFLLVREGKRWVIRKLQNIYTSGQIEPHKKVFCPGSRTHTEFKGAYLKAYVMKHVKQYGSVNFDQLKITFKGETENGLRKVLKSANTVSKDSKVYRQALQDNGVKEYQLIPQQICIYERMQKSLCELKEVGISDIKSNEKMKNVLKQFNKIHYLNPQKIAIARMIREQLQLTSWYLTQSFIKFKNKTSKIQISGFADPTNGRGGYSYINKPQKQRTSKEDMEERGQKPKANPAQDLRKLKVDDSKEMLRQMGHNEDQIDYKGRWQLINILKNKQGTDFSRKERETKNKKIENQKKEINKNFNRLLAYLNDETQEPAFDYSREKKNKLEDYIIREREYIQKIKRKYGRPQSLNSVKEELQSDDSDQDN